MSRRSPRCPRSSGGTRVPARRRCGRGCRVGRGSPRSESANAAGVGQRRQVGDLGFDLGSCRGGELGTRALGSLRVAADDADGRSLPREQLGCHAPEPRRCSGDDGDPPVEPQLLERRPGEEASPDGVADAGEAADDARLERRIYETRPRRGAHGLSAACRPLVARAPTPLKMRCRSGSKRRRTPASSSSAS